MKNRKKLKGVVTSDTMDKTIVVSVNSLVKHSKYRKYIKKSKKYKAHDSENKHKTGDTVVIEECKPISKGKYFRVI